MKPLRKKDKDAITHWIEHGSLVDAYREHIAADPEGTGHRVSAHHWSQQPHIQAALAEARQLAIKVQYDDPRDAIIEQHRALERIYKEGMVIRRDHNGNEAPTNLNAALGARLAMDKLYSGSALSGVTKLAMLRAWVAIQDQVKLPYAAKEAVAKAILEGKPL